MKVYEFKVQEGYEWAVPESDEDFEIFQGFDGSPRAAGWRPIRVELLREDENQRLLPSDMPWLGSHAPVLGQKAVETLGPVLTKDGELLPLACEEADLWVFNATTIRNALDLDRSELVRFSTGRILDVTSYVFRPECLHDLHAFKVPQLDSVFVTEELVTLAATLTGVGFRLLWDGPTRGA